MLELSLPTYCTSYLIYWECSYDQSTKYIGCTIPFLDVQYVWDSPSSLSSSHLNPVLHYHALLPSPMPMKNVTERTLVSQTESLWRERQVKVRF